MSPRAIALLRERDQKLDEARREAQVMGLDRDVLDGNLQQIRDHYEQQIAAL